MFNEMIKKLKKESKRIVFTEGEDIRVLSAAVRLLNEEVLVPVVIGRKEVIEKLAKENNLSISNLEIIEIDKYDKINEMQEAMFEIRKGKMTREQVNELLTKGNYFGTMLVQLGYADGLLGGATSSTADTVRPALQIIKTKPGSKIVSSSFLMRRVKDGVEERYIMADCAINLHPDEDQVVEIALQSAETAKIFGIDPKVVLLSYSSYGSGKGEDVEKMTNAANRLKEMDLSYPVDGELQFDAAFDMGVAKIKAPTSKVAGQANVFVFPDINSGNIGYKIAQRLGDFEALGPILQGLNAPINDLSRGCNAEEVYKMAIITALQK